LAVFAAVNSSKIGKSSPTHDPAMLNAIFSGAHAVKDGGVRLAGIPILGLAIPWLAGLLGPVRPGCPLFFTALAWFIFTSAVIWHGNRYLYLRRRASNDWADRPARRVCQMLVSILMFTIPATAGLCALWYLFAALPVDWLAIRTATVAAVIAVVFITHGYETVYLLQQRNADRRRIARLEQQKMEIELETLRSEIDPHFLFNSLHALTWLIENDPRRAVHFVDRLGQVYRYLLRTRERTLVSLAEEYQFLSDYAALLCLRFEDALQLRLHGEAAKFDNLYLPPVALQTLLENAVKHNEFSSRQPLEVSIRLESDCVIVENEVRAKRIRRPGSGVGLQNLSERFRLILKREMSVEHRNGRFIVRLPLSSDACP
jgi:hypothetical protein